ncbi:hypothetical protein Bca4012_019939 [Brassica carinata]
MNLKSSCLLILCSFLITIDAVSAQHCTELKSSTLEAASLKTFETMHMRMQCTPDVSSKDCDFCLKPCCRGKQGCWVSRPTSLTPQASDRANTTGKDEKTSLTETIVADVIPTIVILAVLVVRFTVCRSAVQFKTTKAATDKFSDSNLIGQGGFGAVYMGKLPTGTEVAVKRLSRSPGQGMQEFKNEAVLTCFNGYFKPNSTYDLSVVKSSLLLLLMSQLTTDYTEPQSAKIRTESSSLVLDPKDIDINLTVFDSVWEDLMLRTITAASSGSRRSFGHKYYAAQIAPLTSFQSLYSMMQCGAYVRPFCLIRWNLYPFAEAFDNIKLPERDGRNTTREGGDEITTTNSLQFSFKTIKAATDKFSDSNMIGRGGFGEVYKGLLSTGTEVAVKRLSKSSGQGAQEFKNEAVLVTKLQYKNLVRLLGFCLEGEEKILVYEFVPNKSLRLFSICGYMSPEYAMRGYFSIKSDVYSFGVMILETISGKRNSSFYNIDDSAGNLVTHVSAYHFQWELQLHATQRYIGKPRDGNESGNLMDNNISNPNSHVTMQAYCQSKLCNILHATELARQFKHLATRWARSRNHMLRSATSASKESE